MANNETISKIFTYGERNNHGPFGPSTYIEFEIELDCSGRDEDALLDFLEKNFCGDSETAEDYDDEMFMKLIGKRLPDNVDEAGTIMIAIARTFKHLDNNSDAEKILKSIEEYRITCREAKTIEAKKRNISSDIDIVLERMREECKTLSKEGKIRALKEEIESKEKSLDDYKSRIKKGERYLADLKKQLEVLLSQ